jgi:hypothetical protein
MDLEANLQVFLKTFKHVSNTDDPSINGLGFSAISEGSRDHISDRSDMQDDLSRFSLNLLVLAFFKRSSIKVLS